MSTAPGAPDTGAGPPDGDHPAYDQAMRRLVGADLGAVCRLLGVTLEPGAGEMLATRFPSRQLDADLLVRVGPRRLLHIEYQLTARRGLALRMLGYRAAVSAAFPDHELEQVVVVLGNGTLDSVDSSARGGFRLGCREMRLREVPVDRLLADPGTAPLAVLGAGDARTRAAAFVRALVAARAAPGDGEVLAEVAVALAPIRLQRNIIDKIVEEDGMTVESIADFWSSTDLGQYVENRAIARGREEGREEGRGAGHEDAVAVALVERFGPQDGAADVAHRLVAAGGLAGALRAVLAAQRFEDLVDATVPTGP